MKKKSTLSHALGCNKQVRSLALIVAPVMLTLVLCQNSNAIERPAHTKIGHEINVKNAIVKVSGLVYDETQKPLSGATITEKGTTNSTVSKADGTFSINISKIGATLIIKYIGFDLQEVKVKDESNIVITMSFATSKLSEVIVVGYGTQKRATATVAASAVKGDVLSKSPVPNISNSLAGNVAGVTMQPNSGRPGDDNPNLLIRGLGTIGSSGPLVVVDGVIRNNINEVDPNMVGSVTVLKDAAAVAPYGLGGANGVILITTKRGASGAPTLSLDTYYGIQAPTYRPKTLSAQDYMRLTNEAFKNSNPTSTAALPFADDLINNYANLNATDPDKYPISDARNQVPKDNSPIQQINLQLTGGTKDVRYFAGIGHINQKGLFDPVNYKRYNYNVNIDVSATPTTTVSLSVAGSIQNTNTVDPGTSADNLYRGIYKFVPTAALVWSNGLSGEFAGNAPLGILAAGYNRRTTNNMLNTISIDQKLNFIKGLSVKGAFSFDPYNYADKRWHTPYYYHSINTNTTPYTYTKNISTSEGAAAPFTSLSQEYWQQNQLTYQGFLNYHNTFGKHDITGLAVAEARQGKQFNFNASRNNYAINVDELSLGSSLKNDIDNGGSSGTSSQLGYVYRLDYAFDNKYLFQAAGRYDGHYFFAPGKRYAFFPSFSAGWVISNEKFLSDNKTISYLKLRGSWGKSGNLASQVGNQPAAFQYLPGFRPFGNAYAFGNAGIVQGSYQDIEANPNITWENSNKSDIGFEATLWDGLLKLDADVFMDKRTGMLLQPNITVPVEYGLTLAQENAGVMKSKGFEATASSAHKFSNGLSLSLSGNFSYANNKAINVYENNQTRANPNRSRTGRPWNTMFGYQSLGLFSTSDDKNNDGLINAADGYTITQFGALHPGDIRYADISGPDGVPDGKINSDDETVIGKTTIPRMTFGFTPTASWKNIDLSLFFQGAAQVSYNSNNTFQVVPFLNNNSNSAYEYYNNRWTPETQNAKYPRATSSPYSNNTQGSDFWIRNVSYLRFRTAMLGYSLPASLSKPIGMKRLRVYVSGQNFLTISKLKFQDPGQPFETAYPNQKIYTMGLNASF